MGAELGATTSMFPADERMGVYLRATGRGDVVPIAARYPHLLAPDKEVEDSPEKYYDRVVRLDLSALEPYVVGPHSPDRARPIAKLAADGLTNRQIAQALFVTSATVETHLRHAFQKLDVKARGELGAALSR